MTFLSACRNKELESRLTRCGVTFKRLKSGLPLIDDLQRTLEFLGRSAPDARVILDGYHFDSDYQRALRRHGFQTLVIEDTVRFPHYYADLLLNQNDTSGERGFVCDTDTTILCGSRFSLLRSEFLNAKLSTKEIPSRAKRLLVTFGGSDPGNITLEVIKSLGTSGLSDLDIKVLVGAANQNRESLKKVAGSLGMEIHLLTHVADMVGLLSWADLAVTAGGTTCWELALMGVPALVLQTAENQSGVIDTLSQFGISVNMGSADSLNRERLKKEIVQLSADQECRLRMSKLGRLLIDGNGADRVVEAFLDEHRSSRTDIRPATLGDARIIWNWRNDPLVRQSAFNSDSISWENHLAWYVDKLNSSDTKIWMLDYGNCPVGCIRYDRDDTDSAQISFVVDPEHRGKGFGTMLIEKTIQRAFVAFSVPRVKGISFVSNLASSKVFAKAGFIKSCERVIAGTQCTVFERDREDGHGALN